MSERWVIRAVERVWEREFSFWVRAVEFFPLYALLLWGWRAGPRLAGTPALGRPGVAARIP